MDIEVNLTMTVDPEANFLGCDEQSTLEVLMDVVKTAFYEIDDVKLTYI